MDIVATLSVFISLLLIIIVYSFLFGETKCHRGGLIDKIRLKLLVEPYFRFTQSPIGKFILSKTKLIFNWIFYRRNPLLQLFYLLLVVGGSVLLIFYGFRFIPGRYLTRIHVLLFPTSLTATLAVFYQACISDPGLITKDNVKVYLKLYRYDDIIFTESECKTCQITKPARSKHCRLCNRCIARFDHHCTWLDNDIGYLNLRIFLLFLLMTSIHIFYVFYLCYNIIYSVVDTQNLWFYQSKHGTLDKTPYFILFKILVYHMPVIVSLLLFTLPVGLMVFSFFIYHLYLVSKNETTNESFKREDLEYEFKEIKKNQDISKKNKDIIQPKGIINYYNIGILNNFKEILYPIKSSLLTKKYS